MLRFLSDALFVGDLSMCVNSDKDPITVGVCGDLCVENSWYGSNSCYLARIVFRNPPQLAQKLESIIPHTNNNEISIF